MSYLLCLGFISYQYKKEPTVRLFVDDIFIDEFELCKSHDSKLFKNNKNIDHTPTIKGKNTEYYNSEYTNYLKQLDPSVPWNMFKKVLKYNKCPLRSDMSLRFYKLHDHFIKKSKNIRLEIQSNDSNFTNGFMTSSTTYSLRVAYLIPQEIYKNPKKYFQKYDQQVKQYNRNHKDQHEIKQNFIDFDNTGSPNVGDENYNPNFGKPKAFAVPKDFGLVARSAYERVIERRFEESMQEELELKAIELSGDAKNSAEYNQRFTN